MNEIKIFENQEFGDQYCILIEGEPHFRAKELCQSLGYSNMRDAIRRHVDNDDVVKHDSIDSRGRTQKMTFVNESGIFALIFGSTLKQARQFKRWVTSDLLPTLRKTGRYELEQQALANELHNKHLLQRVREAEKDAAFSKDMLCMGAELDVRRKVSDTVLYSASEIAKELGHSTQYFNKRLAEMGIIEKEFGIWVIVDRYKSYGYAKLDERSYTDSFRGYDVKVQLMKWTIEGVKFVISMWTGMEDEQVNESVILSNLIRKKRLNLITKQKEK